MNPCIVLLGPPASGKGTLADSLWKEYGIPSVSPGALFRTEKAAGTPLGLKADALTSQGKLVSDMLVNSVISTWLGSNSLTNGAVFDGYPRTLGQAEALCESLKNCDRPLDFAFLLEARATVLRERMKARANCSHCGQIVSIGIHVASVESPCPGCAGTLSRRRDDSVETLASRVREYEDKTFPLIEYYEKRNLLHRVNSECPPEQVLADVTQILNTR